MRLAKARTTSMESDRLLKYCCFNLSNDHQAISRHTQLKAIGSTLRFVNSCMHRNSRHESYAYFLAYNQAIFQEVFRYDFDSHIRPPHFNGYAFPIISALAEQGIHGSIPLVIGDNISYWPEHVFAKTRPSREGNVSLLRLQPVKHWTGLDRIARHDVPITGKSDTCIFRGATTGFFWDNSYGISTSARCRLMHAYGNLASKAKRNSIDIGFTGITPRMKHANKDICEMASRMLKDRMAMEQILSHKYILCPEGNDISTGLKAILASTSIPIMPAPTVESWLLEFDLVPWKHYAPVMDDFSNLLKVLEQLRSDQELQRYIAESGREYILSFLNDDVERSLNSHILLSYSGKGSRA